MKRILLAYILIAVVFGFLFLSFSNYKIGATESKLPLHSEIFKVSDGYGYQIELESRVLIKQEYIPILKGKRPFKTAEDAERTANKVISKLLKKESPILTISELKELQIPEFNLY
ncbi:DUF4907 domain-containing protein [Arenibacter sp. BSSL-BM3]|uniref:DUF4907 domain-containing protein n=1 Tax=Arenibacter arenosicollis TaxID=2762274 RepID=A0ABR7QMP9_9FLAO|nr:DUF4907 domain-containing protein [Arenibacter arenosicollis]MBC8768389.1 DUF4907 domain-containing protein [Arenibacter arenosicollis]